MRTLLLLVLTAVSVQAQSYERPRRAVTAEVLGPYLLGAGVGYETSLARGMAVRGGIGVRDITFVSDGHPAITGSLLGSTGGRSAALEGGVGVTVSEGRGGTAMVPHLSAGLRLSLPVGNATDGGGLIPRDVVVRVGAVGLYDRDGRCCGSERSGFALTVYPSFGAGVAS